MSPLHTFRKRGLPARNFVAQLQTRAKGEKDGLSGCIQSRRRWVTFDLRTCQLTLSLATVRCGEGEGPLEVS